MDEQVQGLHKKQVQEDQVQCVKVGEPIQVFTTIRTMMFLPPILLLPTFCRRLRRMRYSVGRPILGGSTISLLSL